MKHKWKILAKTLTTTIVLALVVGSFVGCGSTTGNDTKDSLAEKAYSVGDTISTMKKAESDKKLHKVEYKITKVVKNQDEVNRLIDNYNTSGKGATIGEIASDDVKYCVAKYEVKYSKDFPAKEYGITDPFLKFKITNENGGATIKYNNTKYKGLSETWEIGSEPMGYDFYPGDTYKGSFVFMMAKGCKEYLFKEGYTDGDKNIENYTRPE